MQRIAPASAKKRRAESLRTVCFIRCLRRVIFSGDFTASRGSLSNPETRMTYPAFGKPPLSYAAKVMKALDGSSPPVARVRSGLLSRHVKLRFVHRDVMPDLCELTRGREGWINIVNDDGER